MHRENDTRGLAGVYRWQNTVPGSVDDVKMRFKAKFARFENWDEEDTGFSTGTVGSKLNDCSLPISATRRLSRGTADFLAAPDDAPAPF